MDLLPKVVESFVSKFAKKFVDYALSGTDKTTWESLQSKMRKLSAKAYDVEEAIKKAERSGKKKRKREVKDWLQNVLQVRNELSASENEIQEEGFLGQFFGGGQAARLDARVHELIEHSHFGELVLDVYNTKGETLLTRKLVGDGFEENLERILKLLLVDKVSSIGIYGMGGIGKTTLAKHINNQLIEQNHRVVWITVSQDLNISMLQDKIAKSMGLDFLDECDEDKKASRLHKALSQMKDCFIILDDVWKNVNMEKLGDPFSVEGCRLILTTRSLQVCRQIGCEEEIKVETLHETESWNLFMNTLGLDMALSSQVQQIAESMVKLCNGLPLGIITLAGSMKGETSVHGWSDAMAELEESILSQEDMDEQVFKVLKYSFDRLVPKNGKYNGYSKFQLCFLYCSLYPEDTEIDREELIRRFIMEDFMDKRKNRKALIDQGHAILDKLVNACLLERVWDSVKMHDLVRAMALKIIDGKTKVIAGHKSWLLKIPGEDEWTKDLEKMSLMKNGISEIPSSMSPDCSKLSTLLLGENPLVFIPNSFFSKMHGLCILDLSKTPIKELPNSLSELEKLKVLLLADCTQLVYIPNMRKLKQLRELDISHTAIHEFPQGMEEAINLQYLSLDAVVHLEILPRGFLLNFPYLQCLHLPHHIQAPIEEMEKLNNLEEFCGRMKDGNEFNLLVKSKPRLSFKIAVASNDLFYGIVIYGGSRQNILSNYKVVEHGDEGIVWLKRSVQPPQLNARVGRSNCLADNFDTLNSYSLEVRNCNEIQQIWRRDRLAMTSVVTSTSVLPSHVHPPPGNCNIFSCLEVLYIIKCNKMKKLGLTASELPNIVKILIKDCEAIEELFEVSSSSSSEESGSRGESGSAITSLPKLRYLELFLLPSLKSIIYDTTTIACSSIQHILLKGCPLLKKFPLVFGEANDRSSLPSSAPVHFRISLNERDKEWWQRMELGHPTHHLLLQPFLSFR